MRTNWRTPQNVNSRKRSLAENAQPQKIGKICIELYSIFKTVNVFHIININNGMQIAVESMPEVISFYRATKNRARIISQDDCFQS